MEFAILFFTLLILVIYFRLFRRDEDNEYIKPRPEPSKPKPKKVDPAVHVDKAKHVEIKEKEKIKEKIIEKVEVKEKRVFISDSKNTVTNLKDHIINQFKEGKDLKNCHIYNNGKTILCSDEKKIYLYNLSNLLERQPKCLTKNIEKDQITDLSYSIEKKIIAVGMKNSKEIIFYEIKKGDDQKVKLEKTENKITSDQLFEINKVIVSKDGSLVATSGVNKDTFIHIYDVKNKKKLDSVNINEIQNIEVKFSPDDRYIAVSTFMYEISVIEIKVSTKTSKNSNVQEIETKIAKNHSIGIKVPILSFDFSNDRSYFAVSSDDKKLKIFQSFAPNYTLEDSKCVKEIDINFKEENFLPKAQNVTLYIIEAEKNELNGVIACSYDNNIYMFNLKGELFKYIPNAQNSEIIKLKIVKDEDSSNPKEIVLVSISREGKVIFFKIF